MPHQIRVKLIQHSLLFAQLSGHCFQRCRPLSANESSFIGRSDIANVGTMFDAEQADWQMWAQRR
jgi:hypothetical protein